MKITFSLLLLVFIGNTVYGQNRTEKELFKSRFSKEKTELVASFMDMTDEESDIFWPLYRSYETERSKTADKRIESLYQYVNFNKDLTNKQANYWYKEYLLHEKQETKIKKKYFKKLSHKISALFSLRFFQMEEFLESNIKVEIFKNLPALENY